jgi:hypothetical protein
MNCPRNYRQFQRDPARDRLANLARRRHLLRRTVRRTLKKPPDRPVPDSGMVRASCGAECL